MSKRYLSNKLHPGAELPISELLNPKRHAYIDKFLNSS